MLIPAPLERRSMNKLALLLVVGMGCSSPVNGGGDRTGGADGNDPGTGGGAATGGRSGDGGTGGRAGGGSGGSVAPGTGGAGMGTGGAGMGTGGAGPGTGGMGTGGAGMGTGGAGTGGAGPGTGGSGGPAPTRGFAFASGAEFGGSQLTIFSLDLMTGALAKKGEVAGGSSPTYLAVHPTGKFLYVNNEQGNRATAFSIGPDGALTMLNSAPVGGNPAAVSVHKSGKWLLSASYNGGQMTITKVAEDGSVSVGSSLKVGAMAHMAIDDGVTGNFVFVPCLGAGFVAMFKFDPATGQATPNSPATVAVGGGPRHMAFNPNGKWAYVTQENGSSLTTLAYDSATGILSAPKNVAAPSNGAHVLVHPNGNFVFHISRGGGTAATTVYKVGADGALSEASKVSGGNDGALTKDGKYLLVVSGTSVKAFAVNAATGALTAAGSGTAVNTAQSVAVATF
jgi:6-phosphogluconolactonase